MKIQLGLGVVAFLMIGIAITVYINPFDKIEVVG